MQNNNKYLYGIIFLLVLYIFIPKINKNSNLPSKKIEVLIPEKKGTIKKPIGISRSKEASKIIVQGKPIYVENPVNKQLLNDFLNARDSIRLLKYAKAIEEVTETRTFDDKNSTIKVKTLTRGEILDMKVDYTFKEHKEKVDIPIVKDNFGFLTGGSYKQSLITQKPILEGLVGVRIKKLNIYISGNTEAQIGVGFIREF